MDFEIIVLLSKILNGLFILLVSLFNIGLIVILIFLSSMTCRPRKYIVASMSVSNLFLALFTFVVYEILLSHPSDVNCKTVKMAATYSSLHSLVIGLSLVMLCTELFFRKKICSMFNRNFLVEGITLSCAPWILALIIILPLNLDGFNYMFCGYEDGKDPLDRARIVVYVSVVIPVCAAVLTSVVIKLTKVPAVAEDLSNEHVNTLFTIEGGNILQSPLPPSAPDYVPPLPPHYPSSDGNDDSPNPTYPTPSNIYVITNNQPLLIIPLQNDSEPTIPANNSEELTSNSIPGPTSASTVTQTSYTVAQSSRVTKKDSPIQREKKALLVMSCLYAVIFLPSAILTLAYIMELKPKDPLVFVTFGYMELLWGIFSPVLWFKLLNITISV